MRNFATKTNHISIDFTKQSGQIISNNIVFTSGDTGSSFILVDLLNNETPINLEGYGIVVNFLRGDIKRIASECNIIDKEKGKIEIPLSQSMLLTGINNLEILLVKENIPMVSPIISYKVVNTLVDYSEGAGITSANEYPILVTLIDDVTSLKNVVVSNTDRVSNLEAQITTSEEIRVANEQVRVAQERERQSSFKNIETKSTEKMNEMDETISDFERRFNSLSPEQSTNAEVQLARVGVDGTIYDSLQERLLKIEQSPSIVWETIEG